MKGITKILPILAVIVVVVGVVFATIANKKQNDESDNTSKFSNNPTGSVPTSSEGNTTSSRPQVKLGNDDEAISYDGPGTARGDGMDTGQGLGYNLGNPDAGIGLEPIAVHDNITEYLEDMFGGSDPSSFEILLSGNVDGKNMQGLLSVSGIDSHIKYSGKDVYIIANTAYVKDSSDYNPVEGLEPITASNFIKEFRSAFGSDKVTNFKHHIESEEKSEKPVNGETILEFTIDAKNVKSLLSLLNKALPDASDSELSGSLEVKATLDRWGYLTMMEMSGKDLKLGEDEVKLNSYRLIFDSIDSIPAIYLPGTEPTPSPTPTTAPENGGGSGGTGEDDTNPGRQNVPSSIKGVPVVNGNIPEYGTMPEAKKTSDTIYHIPIGMYIGEGKRKETDSPSAMSMADYGSFDAVPGVSMLYLGYTPTGFTKKDGLDLVFQVVNITDKDVTIEFPYITINSDVAGKRNAYVDKVERKAVVKAGETTNIIVSTGEIGNHADSSDYPIDFIAIETFANDGKINHVSEVTYIYSKQKFEDYSAEYLVDPNSAKAHDNRTYHRQGYSDPTMLVVANVTAVDPSAAGPGTEGVELRLVSQHIQYPVVFEIESITIEGDGASSTSKFTETYSGIPYEEMVLYPFSAQTFSFSYSTKNGKCTLKGGTANIKIKLRARHYYTGEYVDFDAFGLTTAPAAKLKNKGYVEITL